MRTESPSTALTLPISITVRLFPLAIGLLIILVAAGCRKQEAPRVQPARAVRVAPVSRSSFTVTTVYAARVEPEIQVAVMAKVPGRVASVGSDVGRKVGKGEVLFTLESQDYEAQYRQADAAYSGAKANLNRTNDSSLGQQLLQARAAVDQAQVQYDDMKSAYEKTKALFDGGVVARRQFDDVEARFKAAGIQLEAAKDSLKLLEDRSGPQSTEVVSAQADQAGAQAELARNQLENTVVRSPIDGVVFMRNVEVGELVGSSTAAFVVMDDSTVLARAEVAGNAVSGLKPGMPVGVGLAAGGTEGTTGKVASVSPAADPRTGLYEVKVRLANPARAIRPGTLARLAFPLEERRDVLVVPNQAVFVESGEEWVFVAASGIARKTRVRVGTANETVTEIVSGAAEGDEVVLDGQSFLNEGEAVTIVR
jgi:HlyD family secretion protein